MRRFVLALAVLSLSARADISKECGFDKECLIDVPGTQCADGTLSYFTLTKRQNSKGVLVYLQGGGACWGKESCQQGYARPLTRKETGTNWNTGSGIFDKDAARNPFAKDFDIVTVPYCTGDVYSGDREVNYGTERNPYIIRHRGYKNIELTLAAVKALYPKPDKAAFVGCSAGGIGVYYHLRNFAAAFPDATKFVVSDAGTPFRPPYLKADRYAKVMASWGADKTLPMDGERRVTDFSDLIRFNTKTYPDIKFSFISSYRDQTMSFFALSVGSPSPFSAVRNTIVDLANTYVADANNAHVFYTDSNRHCHTGIDLDSIRSEDITLGQWLSSMVRVEKGWTNVRPDLYVDVSIPLPGEKQPTKLDDVMQ